MSPALRLVREPRAESKKAQFQDANDVLSTFPPAMHERREPTEEEMKSRKKGWLHNKTHKNKKDAKKAVLAKPKKSLRGINLYQENLTKGK